MRGIVLCSFGRHVGGTMNFFDVWSLLQQSPVLRSPQVHHSESSCLIYVLRNRAFPLPSPSSHHPLMAHSLPFSLQHLSPLPFVTVHNSVIFCAMQPVLLGGFWSISSFDGVVCVGRIDEGMVCGVGV